eukprot:TRINITY_DN11938_c0_g1_i1.p1 TRINITY_DN11938_c0_g1~~TRINITY_DN11938_c0_g1_i1.p1  ORF type:complete len:279 (+),score=35.50 TRINITY_DN11938_c0_g1_i1:37-837(+)
MTKTPNNQKIHLTDSHCHLHRYPNCFDHITATTHQLYLMSLEESDWELIENLSQIFPTNIKTAFGVHPWWAHQVEDGWLDRLEQKLLEVPEAMLGELGVDKYSKTPEEGVRTFNTVQKEVFENQFFLAQRLRRPISVHCVQAHGYLFDFFRERSDDEYFPKVMLHSYAGSAEMVQAYRGIRNIGEKFYFSFSHVFCACNVKGKREDLVTHIPHDRLLLESDLEDPYSEKTAMLEIVKFVSKKRGWTVEYTARLTSKNAVRFLEEED